MRQKELRIALICYGGVSLAVYMHGVTKEIWKLARASRDFHADAEPTGQVERVYRDLLEDMQSDHAIKLRILPDILTGASAGGINAVFLAQAIHSGQSLEPLTDMWLECADVDRLTDPDARPVWRFAKFWAQPVVRWILKRPGNAVSETVAPETRREVRRKVSALVRGRWFQPPFSGIGFSRLLHRAFASMAATPAGAPLLPERHPIDLLVTATDFRGHVELLRLNSPPVVEESEHRMPIGFRTQTPGDAGHDLADPLELTFAARATASFPGAFPPLQLAEIDLLAADTARDWTNRNAFLQRIMPVHMREGNAGDVSLIDGSVLVNAPFGAAARALKGRPAQREVDRRFVYIDPRPDKFEIKQERATRDVGFFGAIFGSISTIPREQPIRDNLEKLDEQSREAKALQRMVASLRPEVEGTVERLFGRTFFLNHPSPRRLHAWRKKAQHEAALSAGFAYNSYAQAKFAGIVDDLARMTYAQAPQLGLAGHSPIAGVFYRELERRGMTTLSGQNGGASDDAIAFFRSHDLAFRIRRLRLLARRLARDWEADPDIPDQALETARKAIYDILALYYRSDDEDCLGHEFADLAGEALTAPGAVLDYLSKHRDLEKWDGVAETMLADALQAMPETLRRRMLLAYLGFPYYDISTLTLMRDRSLTEFNPIKVDRISPDDATAIRAGGTSATLRGTEFYNFGAFFSRAYRENDYLWGRLHGAERMIDLVTSTIVGSVGEDKIARFKTEAFHAILNEEQGRLTADPELIDTIRRELDSRPD